MAWCRFVAAFRKWLADCGGGGPLPPDDSSALLPKTELLNHYTQHVQHCPTCLKVCAAIPHALHVRAYADG